MHIYETNARAAQRLLRALSSLAAIALVLGAGTPRVQAQEPAKPAPPAQVEKPKGPQVIGDDSIDPNQPIKSEFVIGVSVVGEQDPSGNYVVDQSGNVSIRYQGIQTPVAIKGLTPKDAAKEIEKFLKTYIKNPQVTVSIISIPRPTIFVSGAVKTPGPVIITQDTTLVDLLSKAEWTDLADLSQVRVTRRERVNGEDKKTQIIVPFDKYIKVEPGTAPKEDWNPVLRDKDSIFVPFKALLGNGVVSVFGEVSKPQQNIPLRTSPPMTVREVINLVGGTSGFANRKAISIRRATVDRALVIDLDKADQGDLVNNIELRPDDAIYVEKLENNAYINVNGGFVKAGKFVYDKRTTLTQIVMEAGGVAPYSKEKDGKIFRHPDSDPKKTQVITFNWEEIKKGKAADIELQAGDSIWVTPGGPAKGFDVFSVLGALTSSVYLYNNLTGNFGLRR